MKNIQEVFDRVEETKREQRKIKQMYKDALDASREYQGTLDNLKKIRQQKKEFEDQVKAELGAEWEKLDLLKLHIREDKEMLTDIAISTMMKGETVKVTDKNETEYEPVFSVRFKKVKEVRKENA